jgi:hypothetical protein
MNEKQKDFCINEVGERIRKGKLKEDVDFENDCLYVKDSDSVNTSELCLHNENDVKKEQKQRQELAISISQYLH